MAGKPRYLRDGRFVGEIKFVTRNEKTAPWIRELAQELEVPLGAILDTMVESAQSRKQFKNEVKRLWHDRYAI